MLRSPLLLLSVLSSLQAQLPPVAAPKEEIRAPRGVAEPRRKLSKTPPEYFTDLLSGNPAVRGAALKELLNDREPASSQPPVLDATLRAVQLDDDPDLEFVFTIQLGPPPGSVVIVADKAPDGWYNAGKFEYWWHWNPDDAEKFVEIHPPFILFRSVEAGAAGNETDAGIYRLWRGQLYKTFSTEKPQDSAATGPARTVDYRIAFRAESFSPWTLLEVRKTETITPAPPSQAKPVRKRSCLGYEWIPATFSFAVSNRATRSVCD